jgi:hypothetical protein
MAICVPRFGGTILCQTNLRVDGSGHIVASGRCTMKFETEFRRRCAERGLDETAILESLRNISALELEASNAGFGLNEVPLPLVERHIPSADPLEKRRLACHCPLASSFIMVSGAGVPSVWCACSAGYEKFLFDVTFGKRPTPRCCRRSWRAMTCAATRSGYRLRCSILSGFDEHRSRR